MLSEPSEFSIWVSKMVSPENLPHVEKIRESHMGAVFCADGDTSKTMRLEICGRPKKSMQ